ncbi:MAG TPA: A24 family peptidase [Bacilli bacterium]
MQIGHYLLITFIIAAFITDIRKQIIPNKLTAIASLAGLLWNLINKGLEGLLFSLAGLISGFVALLLLFLFKAIGAGDVKLFAAVGAIAGTEFVIHSVIYSVIYAGLIGMVILLARKEFVKRMARIIVYIFHSIVLLDLKFLVLKKKECLTFPFMYAVVPGVLTVYIY